MWYYYYYHYYNNTYLLVLAINSSITLLGVNTYSSDPLGDAASDVTGPTGIANDSLSDSIEVELANTVYCMNHINITCIAVGTGLLV